MALAMLSLTRLGYEIIGGVRRDEDMHSDPKSEQPESFPAKALLPMKGVEFKFKYAKVVIDVTPRVRDIRSKLREHSSHFGDVNTETIHEFGSMCGPRCRYDYQKRSRYSLGDSRGRIHTNDGTLFHLHLLYIPRHRWEHLCTPQTR
jgi:hypothetical protein